jgi:addiction module RelB/DinJ family antitoxin
MTLLKTATIQLRVTPRVKAASEGVLRAMGLTMSEAVELFLRRVVVDQRLPFDVIASDNAMAMTTGDLGTSGMRTTKRTHNIDDVPASERNRHPLKKNSKTFFGGGSATSTKKTEKSGKKKRN